MLGRFRKVPRRFREVPRGSAKVPRKLRVAGCELRVASGFRKVPWVFLRILKDLPFGRFRRVPRRFREGSAKVPRGSAKVPQGSAMVSLRISFTGKVLQGSPKVL